MRRALLLTFALLALSLIGPSPAAPAPKPKPKGAEALLYVKRVPGRTDKEQAEIRRVIRSFLIDGVAQWILKPETEIPGLNGPFSVPERLGWRDKNIQLMWVEGTGVLRITCQAGTPREQAAFVNNAVKHGIAWYEFQKRGRKQALANQEKIAGDFSGSDDPKLKKTVEDALNKIARLQEFIADLSEIVVLDLAEVPQK